jgi:uncharacterized protein (TIGR02996 family)
MSAADRAAFLAAIRDNPEDDLPRLIYADWLEEHGEPARAGFIRVQCELARMAADDSRRAVLVGRQNELWTLYADGWRPRVQSGIRLFPFERGFLAQVEGEFRCLELCPELFAEHPVQRVAIYFLNSRTARALARSPWLSRITHLVVNRGQIGNSGLRSIITSKTAPKLKVLRAGRNAIGDVGAQAIAEAPCLADLESLELPNNLITDVGAETLAASLHLNRLKLLDLRGNRIFLDVQAILRARYGSAVKL